MTKEKILEEALKLYAEYGYKGTTMKKIADAVGIKAASIYFFFQNKEELLTEVFHIILKRHQKEIEKIFASTRSDSALESIQKLISGLANYHRNDLVGTRAYVQLITSDIKSFINEFTSYTSNFMEMLFERYETQLKETYPSTTDEKIKQFLEQVVVIADGMFWSTLVYSDEAFNQRIIASHYMIQTLIRQLE